ncbi:MAG: DNA alkylation repair protein [bacterium]|nr:DNA alkylation repair protein [bacterium]
MPSPRLEVLNELKRHVKNDPEYKAFREKCTNMNLLGLRLPMMRALIKEGFSFYKNSDKEILAIWNTIWNEATTHEVMAMALFYYTEKKRELTPMHWKTMKSWVNKLDSWEHADTLCWIYSRIYEQYPKLVEPMLFKWNKSKNPWIQRCSIVSTIYYASKNRKAPNLTTVLTLIEPLISHKDPYVQKAVGWQLREVYNLNPKRGLSFIKKTPHETLIHQL